jgi:hypothetical protein
MTDARQITKARGGKWYGRYGMIPCPAHDDREPSCKIKNDPSKLDGIDVVCFTGCDWRDVKAALFRQGLLPNFKNEPRRCARTAEATAPATILSPEIEAADERRIKSALSIWPETLPLKDTLGWKYFVERRGLHIGLLDLEHALRWHEHHGAIIALMTDATTGQPTGVHRTFIASDGTKVSRKMLGRQGAIRLSPDKEVTEGLGLAEGLEDGLAVLLSGWRPVWVTGSAGALARFPILIGIEALTIFADADGPGLNAARGCKARWVEAGAEVVIRSPGGVNGRP